MALNAALRAGSVPRCAAQWMSVGGSTMPVVAAAAIVAMITVAIAEAETEP